MYLSDLTPDQKCDLADHIFVPSRFSKCYYYVYLEDPKPCLVPIRELGICESRPKKKRDHWTKLDWLIGCPYCIKFKRVCDKCVPAPRLVGIEENPGPEDYEESAFILVDDFPAFLDEVLDYYMPSSLQLKMNFHLYEKRFNDEMLVWYIDRFRDLHGVAIDVVQRDFIYTTVKRVTNSERRLRARMYKRDVLQSFDDIVPFMYHTYDHALQMQWVYESLFMEVDVPDPLLVGIETNPGPQCIIEMCAETHIPTATILCPNRGRAVIFATGMHIGNEEPGPYFYCVFKRDLSFWKLPTASYVVDFETICTADIDNVDVYQEVAAHVVDVSGIVVTAVTGDYEYEPPAPRLVGVEENPGPLDCIELIEEIINFIPVQSIPVKPKTGKWGDIDQWEEEMEEAIRRVVEFNDAILDTFVIYSKFGDPVVDFVPAPRLVCVETNPGPVSDFVTRIIGNVDPLGTGIMSETIKEATANVTETVKESIDKVVDEGVKHVHVLPPEVMTILKSIQDSLLGFKTPDVSSYIDSFVKLFPGFSGLDKIWSETIDPRSRDILVSVVVATMSCVAAKYELGWKAKLLVVAIQWGIVLKTDNEFLKKQLMILHGIEFSANLLIRLTLLIQTWLLEPEGDYEAQAVPLLETIAFSTKHTIPILAKSIISIITFQKCEFSVDSFLSGCKLYKQLINGFEFTIATIVDLVRRILELMGSTVGFTMFREAYSDYPEIYKIMDVFNSVLDKITQGVGLKHKDFVEFRTHANLLASVEKKLSLKASDSVYQSQVRVLRQTCDSLKKAFGCQGLKANNYRHKPFAFVLTGPSAIGKTPLLRLIFNGLARFTSLGREGIQDFIDHPETYLHMWAECEFHDNYVPGTIFLGYDDFCQTKKATTPERCPLLQSVYMNNNAPNPVNCSESARKNTVFMEHEIQGFTSNRARWKDDDFHTYQLQAGLNRMGIAIKVDIKDEFKKTSGPEIDGNWGYTLDKNKVDVSKLNLHVYNFIHYNIYDNSPIQAFDNFEDLMMFLARSMVSHKRAESIRMQELLASVTDPAFNPLWNKPDCEIFGDATMVEYVPASGDEEIQLLIKKAIAEYKEKERRDCELFDASREEFKARFNYKMSDPTNPLWYFNIIDGLFWQKIFSQDPGWADFVDKRMSDLMNWMDGTAVDKIIKSVAWKQFSPTEIPHDIKVVCSMMRLVYFRMSEMSHRYALTFTDLFNVMTKMTFDQAMDASYSTIKDLFYMELRDSLKLAGDLWQGTFSFCGAWTRYLLMVLPGVVASAFVVDKMVAASGVRLKKVRFRPRVTPKVTVVKPEATIGDYIATGVDVKKMAMQAASVIRRNNKYAVFVSDGEKKLFVQSLLFIAGRAALGTNHLGRMFTALEENDNSTVIYLVSLHSGNEIPVLARYIKQLSTFGDKCLYSFHILSNVHSHKSILKYLADDKQILEKGTNILLSVTRSGSDYKDVEHLFLHGPVLGVVDTDYRGAVDEPYRYKGYAIDAKTIIGDCGSEAFISDTRYTNWHMVGFIAAAHREERFTVITPLSKQLVKSLIDQANASYIGWSGPQVIDDLEIPTETVACSALPPKFLIHSVDPPVTQSTSTKYQKTALFGEFGEPTKYPAMQSEYEVNGNSYDPMYMARDKYCNSSGVYNPSLMAVAISMYLYTLLPVLYTKPHQPPKEFTPEEVTVGNGYVEATPRNTSVGYSYQLRGITKQMLFGVAEVYDTTNVYCQNLFNTVREAIAESKLGKVFRRISKDFGKDETLSIEKIEKGKLRMVSGSDVEDLTEDKCKLGYAVAMITDYPVFSGTAAGLNPYSTDWDTMYHYFDGYNIIAGDFKNWDGVVFLNIAYMVLYILFCSIYYTYDQSQMLGLYTLFTAASTSLHAACFATFTVVYCWVSGLESGRYYTLVGNSMYNCVLLRYLFLISYLRSMGKSHLAYTESEVLDVAALEDMIRVVTCGDDHVVGIRKDIDWCTHQDFERSCSELGIIYTDDQKGSGEVKPLRTMEEVSFEQRIWRFCCELNRYVGPLKIDTLYNMLYWTTTREANIKEVSQTVIDEFSLWGEHVFNEHVPPILVALVKHYGFRPIRTEWKQCLYFITSTQNTFH